MSFKEWKKYKLGDIVDDVAMGPFGSNIKTDNFISSGVPVIRGSNLNEGGLENNKFVYISESKANSLKRSLAFPDDLVFTHRGTLGQVLIIPHGKYPKYLVSQSQMKLTVNKKILDPKFLYYFFRSKIGQYELLKNSSQVGVPAIASPTKSLKEIDITIPLMLTQQKIVAILSSLDDKIELNRQTNKTLEAIAQTLFKEMCVPKGNELPFGWKDGVLFDIGKLIGGGTPKTDVNEYWENGTINWISAKDITPNNGTFITQTEKKITDLGLKNSSAKLVKELSTIISARGTVGNVCIISKQMTISQSNYALTSILPNTEYYLFYVVLGLVTELKQRAYGTIFDTITTNSLADLKIIVPPVEVLMDFNKVITPFFEKIKTNILEVITLTNLRDSLLPKLMKGEFEIQ